MDCIFCKIVKGHVPSYKVWEDENYLAFLDIFPIKTGHTMVIPKKHHPYIFEIPDEELQGLSIAAKKVAERLKKAFKPKTGKVGVIVYGLDVDHTHIHLVPLDRPGDLNMGNKAKASDEELSATLKKLQED